MYFVRVDFVYDHGCVQRTRDIVDDEFAVIRLIDTLAKQPKTKILQVHVELCK